VFHGKALVVSTLVYGNHTKMQVPTREPDSVGTGKEVAIEVLEILDLDLDPIPEGQLICMEILAPSAIAKLFNPKAYLGYLSKDCARTLAFGCKDPPSARPFRRCCP
jgi:hypothetical protein